MVVPSVSVIDDPAAAAILLEPTRLRLVRELAVPDSATGLSKRLGLPRQRINYHLRELERAGLVQLVEERRKRNCTERIVQATARSYLVSPDALTALGTDPDVVRDQFSWSYLVAVAARAIRDLSILKRWADRAKKKLATWTLETELRVESAEALHAFSEELANAVAGLAAKYHNEHAETGRVIRFFFGAYPSITKKEEEAVKP